MAKTFNEIPHNRPDTPLLDGVNVPADLRHLNTEQLLVLADELRSFLLYCVGKTGGHFGAGLGVTELTIALHHVFNTPEDRLVWDVGHQTYPHKILTGRREQMLSMRQKDGLSGFPKRSESEYDTFGVGHSSTSISAALGMAMASAQLGEERKTVAIMGDGAMTAGMAFEALNHASHVDKNCWSYSTTIRCRSRATSADSPPIFPNSGLARSTPSFVRVAKKHCGACLMRATLYAAQKNI